MTRTETIKWLLSCGVLKFGDFTLKSGKKSRYFFNMGAIFNGNDVDTLGKLYCNAIRETTAMSTGNVVFGPAYKGIPLAVTIAIATSAYNDIETMGYCFDRKVEKDHGDGGKLVGKPLAGQKVILVDDVITSGISLIEAAERIEKDGGDLIGILVGIDRMEPIAIDDVEYDKASDYVQACTGVSVVSVLTIEEIINDEYAKQSYTEECMAIEEALKGFKDEAN